MNKPYYILSPSYQSNSGGIMILYKLRDMLVAQGQVAVIVNGPVAVPENSIAVYPEIYKGNPLGSKTVARFVLNAPGRIGGDRIYDVSELVFVFDHMFDKFVMNKIRGRLFIPYIERDLFVNRGLERTKKYYYVGKGPWNKVLPKDVENINERGPVSRTDLAIKLNEAQVLYCFDYATIMMQEAALCGCPVILLADNIEEHRLCGFRGNGAGSTIEEAMQTLPDAITRMDEVELEAIEQVKEFITITQRGK